MAAFQRGAIRPVRPQRHFRAFRQRAYMGVTFQHTGAGGDQWASFLLPLFASLL